MFGKGLRPKKAQCVTCFIVCLLCFAFGLIVKPNLKQHPMLQYSMGFLILHYHFLVPGFDLEINVTESKELIWTVKKKAFTNDSEIPKKLREVGEVRNLSSTQFKSVSRSIDEENLCSLEVDRMFNCSPNGFSIKEDVISLFGTHLNSERHFDISKFPGSQWGVNSYGHDEWDYYPEILQKDISRMVEFEFELQKTKVMLMVYVYHFDLVSDKVGNARLLTKFKLGEIPKSFPLEEIIRNSSLKLLLTSEELLTNVAYSGFLLPYYMGQTAGAFLIGFLVNFFTRKKMLITISLTLVLSKLLLLIPKRFDLIFVQKQLTGFGLAGFYIVLPTYICEVAEENVRGVLASFLNLFLLMGRLRLFFVDGLSVYHHLSSGLSYIDYSDAVSIVVSIIFLIASPWLIESPPYLLLKNKTDKAEKALVKLGRNANDFELENLNGSNVSNGTNGWLKNVTPNFVTVKSLIICCALIIIQFLSFNDFKENFSRGVLKKYNTLLNAYNILWIEISLQLTALVFVIVLIDRAGRRLLLLASCLGMAFFSFILLFMYFAVSFSSDNWIYWIPVISWAGFHFCFHLGVGSIPWILFAEILNTKARGPGMAFMVLITVAFSIILHFNLIPTEHDYLTAIQGVNGALGALFVYFYVPKTTRKSLEVILEELKNKININDHIGHNSYVI